MNQAEACIAAEQSDSSAIDITIDTTMTKLNRKRAPIPSILFHQDLNIDTPIGSETPASNIPTKTETTAPEGMKNDSTQPPSPMRTLKRKKRLSLLGLSGASPNGLAPPDTSMPFSPPPFQLSPSAQFSPTLPVISTPPESSSHTYSTPEKISPTIVISAPTSITPMVIEPSRPISPLATRPPQALPRIGSPERPYYSTVRANMNNGSLSSSTNLTTPPASPSSPTFLQSASSLGCSRSPASGGAPGNPDPNIDTGHLDANVPRRPVSMLDSNMAGEKASPKSQRPVSTSALETVPPLSPVSNSPVPISIPAQMHIRPSSPATSILSVLDPVQNYEEDEDEEAEYNQYGLSSSGIGRMLRERRSIEFREKEKGFHFPLLSLGRKRGRTLASADLQTRETEKDMTPSSRTLNSSRSYSGFGLGRGCSMSGEVEMRMALAERSLNANGGSDNGLESAFKFRQIQPRPSYDAEGDLVREKIGGRRLHKMRSTIGISSTSLTSPPSSPSRPKFGTKLKEMGINLLGKFQGDPSRS
ncbi:hypothetical protein AN958_08621 [Leucoagaricus sp. SymC.cos]|nr:hypothetical protein AN958_08621 [Leucoagaricus sp. SymC.cos]